MKVTTETIALYDKLVKTNPKVERKGATMPYTSLKGNMFSFLGEHGMSLRLPEKVREEFVKKYKTSLYKTYGTVMKEYVVVPNKLLRSTGQLKKYFEMSYSYAKKLKPKPTTRKKK